MLVRVLRVPSSRGLSTQNNLFEGKRISKKKCYSFKYPNADDADPLLYTVACFVKIEKEGESSLFFDEPIVARNNVKFAEPKINCRHSIAKKTLGVWAVEVQSDADK